MLKETVSGIRCDLIPVVYQCKIMDLDLCGWDGLIVCDSVYNFNPNFIYNRVRMLFYPFSFFQWEVSMVMNLKKKSIKIINKQKKYDDQMKTA